MSLIDVAALASQLDDPKLVVLDCRFDLADPSWGARVHAEASLPGAVHVDLDRDLSGPIPPKGESRAGGRHPLPALEDFRRRMARWGVESDSKVVAFDHRGGPYAARLWWMLGAAGHEHIALLDGGIDAWTGAGHALAPGRVPEGYAARPELEMSDAAWPGTVDATQLLARLGELRLFDARGARRFAGEVEPMDRFAGHIPGAHSLPFAGNLDEGGRFKSAEMLRERFSRVLEGSEDDARVAYCGSGVTACHNLLALKLAGLGEAKLYPGSWSDWSHDPSRPREP